MRNTRLSDTQHPFAFKLETNLTIAFVNSFILLTSDSFCFSGWRGWEPKNLQIQKIILFFEIVSQRENNFIMLIIYQN